VALVVVTHYIQNPLSRKTLPAWVRHLEAGKESPIADMILDLRSLPRWEGPNAPVALEQGDVIQDAESLDVYWRFLRSPGEKPKVDFNQNALLLFFAGQKKVPGYSVNMKRMETKPDATVVWVEVDAPAVPVPAKGNAARPWILQLVPKPPKPVIFKMADS